MKLGVDFIKVGLRAGQPRVRTMTFPVNVMVSNWNYHALFPPKLSAIYNHLTQPEPFARLSRSAGQKMNIRTSP
jgi:hypothetical protein